MVHSLHKLYLDILEHIYDIRYDYYYYPIVDFKHVLWYYNVKLFITFRVFPSVTIS